MARKNRHGQTDRQRTFADNYLADPERNAARAYRMSYPSSSATSAETNGPRLLRNAQVASYIEEALEKLHERYEVTDERVVQELAAVAFSNMGEFVESGPDCVKFRSFSELTRDQCAAIAELVDTKTRHGQTTRLKLRDKIRALELLGKDLGMFKDKPREQGMVNFIFEGMPEPVENDSDLINH